MDPNIQPDFDIMFISEVYPNSPADCLNSAISIPITQTYYNCFLLSDPDNIERVTKESYNALRTLPFYQSRVQCDIERVTNDACFCPSGFTGALCGEAAFSKCYVNMTNPAMYKGCREDKVDSDFYVYSI